MDGRRARPPPNEEAFMTSKNRLPARLAAGTCARVYVSTHLHHAADDALTTAPHCVPLVIAMHYLCVYVQERNSRLNLK